MKPWSIKILSLALTLTMVGCAGIPFLKNTIAPKTQYRLEQATVYSPDEADWSLMEHRMHSAAFAKNLEGGSAVLVANMFKVGAFKTSKEFLKYIAKQREAQDNKSRFKILEVKNEFVTFKQLPCLKYQTLSEDHKDKGIHSSEFDYLKVKGYICRYPLEYIAFQMEASHRSKTKEFPKALSQVGDNFFKNIELVDGTIKRLKKIK
jgi:hypothetical protein